MKQKIISICFATIPKALHEAGYANIFSLPDALFPGALYTLKVQGGYKAQLCCVTRHMGAVCTVKLLAELPLSRLGPGMSCNIGKLSGNV